MEIVDLYSNLDRSDADATIYNRLGKSSRNQYKSALKHLLKHCTAVSRPEQPLVNGDGNIILPLPESVVANFLSSHKFKANGLPYSSTHQQQIKSSLKLLYEEEGLHEEFLLLEPLFGGYLKGYRKEIATERLRGTLPSREGKSPFSFSGEFIPLVLVII
jgi:hypothetical protein